MNIDSKTFLKLFFYKYHLHGIFLKSGKFWIVENKSIHVVMVICST
jgi:hypothetical protein